MVLWNLQYSVQICIQMSIVAPLHAKRTEIEQVTLIAVKYLVTYSKFFDPVNWQKASWIVTNCFLSCVSFSFNYVKWALGNRLIKSMFAFFLIIACLHLSVCPAIIPMTCNNCRREKQYENYTYCIENCFRLTFGMIGTDDYRVDWWLTL